MCSIALKAKSETAYNQDPDLLSKWEGSMSDPGFEQEAYKDVAFADNPENRCPVVLVLDTSGSMAGKPIQELNAGLQTLQSELADDPLAAKRVEVAIVT